MGLIYFTLKMPNLFIDQRSALVGVFGQISTIMDGKSEQIIW